MKVGRFLMVATLLAVATRHTARASDFSWPTGSLQALVSTEDCESVPELIGDWIDGEHTVTIRKLDDCRYRLLERVDDPTANRDGFDISVVRLAGRMFFDATAQRIQPDGKEAFGGDFWIPIHFIGVLEIENDAVHLRLLDDDWLQESLKTGRVRLTISGDEHGNQLLTATSRELREFVRLFAADPRTFGFDYVLNANFAVHENH